jgi:hypothetical protein
MNNFGKHYFEALGTPASYKFESPLCEPLARTCEASSG